jgi:branched-chain amino acid transport system ATP-binding protein
MVALARALVCGTKLLLLDEPFEGVAPALAQRLAAAISALRDAGVSVLLSESDYVHSAELVDRLYVIERGIVSARETAGAA